ncbi:MAG: ATP phosphoribosyltransferase regulatory subunit [Beijerinckiaceae bacterium]
MTTGAEDSLVRLFERAGYSRAEAALLHPADVFIDLSGEDIRRRLYLTQDAEGRELCLRPEFTIPLCRSVAVHRGPLHAAMSYCGPVFRHRPGESGEFVQAGVESLGRTDAAAADAEMIAIALEASAALGLPQARVRFGDVALLDAVLAALGASASFVRRLKRRLAAGKDPSPDDGGSSAAGLDRYGGVLAALEGAGPEAARAFVTDMLSMTGVQVSGGRSVAEIAERFLAKAQAGDAALPREKRDILRRFLDLAGDPDHVADRARALGRETGLDLDAAISGWEARAGFLAARGVDLSRIDAQTRFVRSLDYYTGMIFEIADEKLASGKPLIGGGRYDSLLGRLGAAGGAPAVGFSVWVERFAGAGS